MPKTSNCTICGKSSKQLAMNKAHPEKPICFACLNGYVMNPDTIEEELGPLSKALNEGAAKLKKELDKEQKRYK